MPDGPSQKVIAHRGASHLYPENTIAAFEGARRAGADWVELDVHLTADEVLAVHHDEHLADGRRIDAVARAALPAEVPALAEALVACGPLGVNVELKSHPPARHDAVIRQLVADLDAWGGEVLVSSFDGTLLGRVRELAPALPTALLVLPGEGPAAVVGACTSVGHVALHPWDGMVDEELVRACAAASLAVNVWTVDDPVRIRELQALGVQGIVTNEPEVALHALGRSGGEHQP